jgi:hypothetical protein
VAAAHHLFGYNNKLACLLQHIGGNKDKYVTKKTKRLTFEIPQRSLGLMLVTGEGISPIISKSLA